jgi:hypothetical protein
MDIQTLLLTADERQDEAKRLYEALPRKEQDALRKDLLELATQRDVARRLTETSLNIL